ncbi:MAG TPA: SAM-dependent methyltransferase [Candidatus Limnocylindrales bacterium]
MSDASIQAGLRRVSDLEPDAPLPASDPELLARIRDEIARDGPMTMARFMELALYDPQAGYYTREPGTAASGPGGDGDFLTAPEGHPIFGWALARRLERAWEELGRPDRFVVREHGAGRGALASAILGGLRRSASQLLEVIHYQAIDVSPRAARAFAARIEAAGLQAFVEPADARPAPGAVIANELLDALPVHQVVGGDDGQVRERFVTLPADHSGDAGAEPVLACSTGAPSTPRLAERLAREGVELAPGQVAEVCLDLDDWVAAATRPLERGQLIVIDYGADAASLYAASRGSTLRAYHRHRVHDDPLVAIGRQDLTAHVDLTALDAAARAAGLTPGIATTQAGYLADLGLGELLVSLQQGPTADLGAYLQAKAAVVRLLDPRATGRFAVREFER